MALAAQGEYELYKRLKLLGEGAFGKAYLVECLADKQLCVIKQVDLSKLSQAEKDETLKEAKILGALQHPNIVKFREVYKTKKGKLCIVMDYADGGDLSSKIKAARSQQFPEPVILDWFTQICLAMKHVHDRKIIHRDLKGQNIFLTKNNNIKLGDFGIARVLSNTKEKAKTMVGTPYYLSPEIIENKPYSFKSDIWSLGVVLYELCALKPPFTADSLNFLALKIVRGQYNPVPPQYSRELKNLIGSMLMLDPTKRPSINQILSQPIIQARVRNFLTETIRVKEFSHTVLHNQKAVDPRMKLNEVKAVANEEPMPDHILKRHLEADRVANQAAQAIKKEDRPPLPPPKPQISPPLQNQPQANPGPKIVQTPANANYIPPAQQPPQKQNYHYAPKNQPPPGPPPPAQVAYQPPREVIVDKGNPYGRKEQPPRVYQPQPDKNYAEQIMKEKAASKEKARKEEEERIRQYHLQAAKDRAELNQQLKRRAEMENNDAGGGGGGGGAGFGFCVANDERRPKNSALAGGGAQVKPKPKPAGRAESRDRVREREIVIKEEKPLAQKPKPPTAGQGQREESNELNQKRKEIADLRNQAALLNDMVGRLEKKGNPGSGQKLPPSRQPDLPSDKKAEPPKKVEVPARRQSPGLEKQSSAEKEREEREKRREEERKKMLEDIKSKRAAAQNQPRKRWVVEDKKEVAEDVKVPENKTPDVIVAVPPEKPRQKWKIQEEVKEEPKPVLVIQEPEGVKHEEFAPAPDGQIHMTDLVGEDPALLEEMIKQLNDVVLVTENDGQADIDNMDENQLKQLEKRNSEGPQNNTTRDSDREDDPEDLKETPKTAEKEMGKEERSKKEEYLYSDFNKIESLKMVLEEKLGDKAFLQVYKIIGEQLEKSNDLDEIEKNYCKPETMSHMFPNIDKSILATFLPLVFTVIIMENLAEDAAKRK